MIGFITLVALLTHLTLNGDDAAEAERLARIQLGDRYAYYVSSIRRSGNHVVATVTVYSESELRYTEVSWDKR